MSEQHVLATLFSFSGILGLGRFKDKIYGHNILLFRMCVCVHVCMYVCLSVYIYVYVYIYIYIYINTYDIYIYIDR